MSEPKAAAGKLEEISAGVFRYHLMDDRIESESDAYVVTGKEGAVLIDPLPLEEAALKRLGRVEAIVLSASCHQRSAWRYRKKFGVKVHAPAGAENLEEKPDATYKPGDQLPGGLRAIHAPGPTDAHYAFHLDRGKGIVFGGDLMMNLPRKGIAFVPGEYQDDPQQTRESVQKLLGLKFETLCMSHGAPIPKNAHGAIADLLKKDSRAQE